MPLEHNPPAEVVEAFHMMWGNFPEPVSLVHKTREVIAVNKAHEALGFIKPGMNCAKAGSPELHKGCLANQALQSGRAAYRAIKRPDLKRAVVGFWLPLEAHPEFYVHFGFGASIDYWADSEAGDN